MTVTMSSLGTVIRKLIDHLHSDAPVFARLEGEGDAAGELAEQVVVERARVGCSSARCRAASWR